jgi:hypothetical protein
MVVDPQRVWVALKKECGAADYLMHCSKILTQTQALDKFG